jgi:hypothetical protein
MHVLPFILLIISKLEPLPLRIQSKMGLGEQSVCVIIIFILPYIFETVSVCERAKSHVLRRLYVVETANHN